jgi:hypothetical protein
MLSGDESMLGILRDCEHLYKDWSSHGLNPRRSGGVVTPGIRFRGVMNTGLELLSGSDPWCEL